MDVPAAQIASPMIRAYATVRSAVPDHLVLYRVGEFYEVLFDEAATVSRALGIQLTRRRQKDADDIPMCGIPASNSGSAIARLLAAGFKLAISEQPLQDGSDRPLRVLTPATSVDPDVVAPTSTNNLTVAHADGETIGFAWLDLSTGEAGTSMSSNASCGAALARISPTEVLVSRWPEDSDGLAVAIRSIGVRSSELRGPEMDLEAAQVVLTEVFGNPAKGTLSGFSPPEMIALAALFAYVRRTVGQLPASLLPPRRASTGDILEIDAPTLRGLEVMTSPSGREGSLLSAIDRTVTSAGARLLVRQLAAPLTKPQTIRRRLEMIRFLVSHPDVRSGCREDLSSMPDVLRACGRLSLRKAGPRDLGAVRDGLCRAAALAERLQTTSDAPPGLQTAARDLGLALRGECAELRQLLQRALVAFPTTTMMSWGFIADKYVPRLDEARSEVLAAKNAMQALQAHYVEKTGVKGLRIKVNTVIGYHAEVPSASAGSMGPDFTIRQGLASTTRYSSAEIDQRAIRLEEVSRRAETLEEQAFVGLSNAVLDLREPVARIAHAASALDLVCGLAQAAAEGGWSEPELSDDIGIEIVDGRHPVAERLLELQGRAFVENNCVMGQTDRLWLLTGPNMAGKSTFLRQVALIVLMAQIGSFVPASRARIGVVDKLFSRIGAADDLAAGRSTFYVEMLETSAILNQATRQSLVILDEVGRGTSTQDGLAIAQATMEYLHDIVGCRALFATHYHELADVADTMTYASCMAMDASAGRHDDLFSYKVIPGRSGNSYGLKIATLAGMPAVVVERASMLIERKQAATTF